MNQKPALSDEEIRSHMDFDRLLQQAGVLSKKHKLVRKAWTAAVAVGVTLTAVVLYLISQPGNKLPEPERSDASRPEQSIPRSHMETDSVMQEKKEEKQPFVETKKKNKAKASEKESVAATDVVTEVPPVYVEAQPVTGFPQLYEYFSAELKYPPTAVKDSIQGIVTVTFIINREGKPDRVNITNSLGPAFDEEALRLVANMPAWNPATLDGKPVPSKISLPLTFRIEPIKK